MRIVLSKTTSISVSDFCNYALEPVDKLQTSGETYSFQPLLEVIVHKEGDELGCLLILIDESLECL